MRGNQHDIQVLIVSRHPVFRDGRRQVLEGEDGFEDVGVASEGTETSLLALKLMPDISLFELEMSSDANGRTLRGFASLPSVRTLQLIPVPHQDRLRSLRLADTEALPRLLALPAWWSAPAVLPVIWSATRTHRSRPKRLASS